MTNIKIIFCGLLLFYSISSCTPDKRAKQDFTPLELKGSRWHVEQALGRVYTIDAIDGYLIARNDDDTTKLTAIKLNDRAQIFNFGKRGDGPQELINPGPIVSLSNGLGVFDGGKMELFRYGLKDKKNEISSMESVFRTNVNGIVSLQALSDSAFVGSGVFPNGKRLCVLNDRGQVLAWLVDYPQKDIPTETPFHVLGMAYQSVMCKQSGGRKIALATRYGDVLDIYELDINNKLIKEINVVDASLPKLTTQDVNGTPNFHPDKNTKRGYLSVTATDKYILALYSGRYQHEDMFYAGNHVHVFSWNGDSLYDITLDRDVTSITVTEESLLALREDSDFGYDIIEFKLPKELK